MIQFRLECSSCGATNNCGKEAISGNLACGECGAVIKPNLYPEVVEFKAKAKAQLKAKQEHEKQQKRDEKRAKQEEEKRQEQPTQAQLERERVERVAEGKRIEARQAVARIETEQSAARKPKGDWGNIGLLELVAIFFFLIGSVFFVIGCVQCFGNLGGSKPPPYGGYDPTGDTRPGGYQTRIGYRWKSDNAVGATANALEKILDKMPMVFGGVMMVVGMLWILAGLLLHVVRSLLWLRMTTKDLAGVNL